jgi:ABC-type transport system involved in multi-copper enzyme maturation permease subunit
MVGPLFYQEMLLGSRRSREHIFRWVYAGWLLMQLLYFAVTDWFLYVGFATPPSQAYTPYVSRHFVEIYLAQHFILLMLVTPAFVAGAVSDEKTKGTLQYLLTTDLAPIHIIVGKLLGRIFMVCVLALAGLPLFALLGAFGGVEPPLLIGLLIVTVFVATGVASATFLAAVWTKQTRDAVLGLYGVGLVAALLGWWVGGPFNYFNPVYLLDPVLNSGGLEAVRLLGQQLLLGLLAWGGLTLACLGLAAWRLRPAYVRQLQGEGRSKRRRWWRVERAPVGNEPVRWKEQNVEGLAPTQALRRVPRWLGIAAILAATVLGGAVNLYAHRGPGVTAPSMLDMVLRLDFLGLWGSVPGADDGFLLIGVVAAIFFSLLVGIRCSGAVSGERERQTWEALLLTPLDVKQLIRGKLWGIMLISYIYLAAYAVPALLLAILAGPRAIFWTLLWLGVTVLAMYYIGAAGLWSSVRSKGSWRGLLSTLGWGYAGGFVVSLCLSPVIFIITWIILIILMVIDARFGTNLAPGSMGGLMQFFAALTIAICLTLAIMFWVLARLFLGSAQKWIADRERTRHWEEEPAERPRRRRRRRVARERLSEP